MQDYNFICDHSSGPLLHLSMIAHSIQCFTNTIMENQHCPKKDIGNSPPIKYT